MSVNTARFQAARTAAGRLRNISTDYGNVGSAVRTKAGGVSQFWTGLSANALTDELTRWSRNAQNTEREIANLAADIVRTADSLEAAAIARAAEEAARMASAAARTGINAVASTPSSAPPSVAASASTAADTAANAVRNITRILGGGR